MATYDNRHWLLAHVRNSFISTDDTGMCEIVMLGEDLPKLLRQTSRDPNFQPKPCSPDPGSADAANANDTAETDASLLVDSDADSDFEKEYVTEFDCYPDMDYSDDEDMDPMAESYDLQYDMDFGIHRQRSNTAQRLEKMEHAQRKAAKIKIVRWEYPTNTLTDQEREQLFTKKELNHEKLHNGNKVRKKSVLSDRLEKCLNLPQNEYLEYAMFDGAAQFSLQIKTYKIFMTMLPEELRNYPINVCVIASAKIRDLIGFICYKYSFSHPEVVLSSVSSYGLVLCEDDGEVDTDLPCLDANEPCSKYGFTCLGLIDLKTFNMSHQTECTTCSIPEKGGFHTITLTEDSKTADQGMRSRSATFEVNDKSKNLDKVFDNIRSIPKNGKSINRTNSTVTFKEPKTTVMFNNLPSRDVKMSGNSSSAPPSANADSASATKGYFTSSPQETEALNRMKEHELAIEAPLYQSYHVQIVNKMRANSSVLLGISGDKIEIDPLPSNSNIFWPRMKSVTYSIDSIAWCELIEIKSSRGVFRLVYSRNHGHNSLNLDTSSSSSTSNQKSVSFKHFDFECDHSTAKEIVDKINLILDLKSSICRREYKAAREKKQNIRRSFHQPKNI